MQLVLFNLIDRVSSGATISGQSEPGSNGNEGVLHIPQSSSITGTSPSDCLVSYPEYSLGGGSLTPLQRFNRCNLQSGPGSDGNEGVLRIPLSSSITETAPSDCLVS